MSSLRRRTNSDQERKTVVFEHYSREDTKKHIIPLEMTARDRTGEFMSVVKSKVSIIFFIFVVSYW